MGDTYLLPAIAAVVLGGTRILGGRGMILEKIAGVILITLLQSVLSVVTDARGRPANHLRIDHHCDATAVRAGASRAVRNQKSGVL